MRGTRMVLTLIICIIICVAGLTNSQEHLTHDTTLVEFNSANLSQVERMTPGVKNQLVSLAENKCHEQPPASTSKHAASQHSCTSPASTDLVHKRPSAKLESDTSPVTLRDKIKNINKVLFDRYEKEETSADMLDAASLSRMLVAVVEEEMEECNVVVAYDAAYSHPAVLHRLLLLPNARQVVKVNKTQDLLEIVWVSSGYLFVVPSKDDLEFLALSEKGKKTEHIVGATESGAEGEWGVYMNQLYWSQGVKRVTTWRGHRFSSQVDLFPDKLRDLQGAVLKAVAFEWKPSVFYQRAKNGTVLLRYGIDIGVVKTLAQVLNFTIQFVEPPEGQHWGYEVNGSWTGMVGMLSKNEVDMGMVNLYVSIVRTSILDYTELLHGADGTASPTLAGPGLPLPGHHLARYLNCGEEMKSLQSLSFSCYYALGLHCCEAQFEEPPEGQHWGYIVNGSWTGMMGMLSKNEVDMAMVVLYVSVERTSILDYSMPYDSELSCFMARTEPPLPRWQALAYPFQGITWLAILIGLIISGPVLYLLARGSAVCGEEMKSLQSLSFSCYYALGLHCCEAQVTLPQMKSTRVFIIFLWLYTITITIAYSTNLTAFLMVSKSPATIQTIKELHASRKQVSGMGEFYKNALASASDPYLQSLTNVYQGYNKDEHIFPGVLDGKAVFLQNRAYIEYLAATKLISRGQSRIRVMKECFSPYNIALGLQRHSPIKRKFDQVIGWMLNAGLTRHFFLTSLKLAAKTSREGDDEAEASEVVEEREVGVPLSLDHLQSIFYIIFVGWVISFLLFLVEVFL
ncbi:Glutamate receptor ionotropic, delta-1-like 30 [Homarus americanus]|uniref:Glutamate receptor ionotropic, delta-1-like 30 n=1 Tax=Homarus americanus TaxID=6706 RepID=A0A8J5T917_HOMAM|nr:Glutamate receptor ionotropic, delta-1-like 30 [Homarus americanus]